MRADRQFSLLLPVLSITGYTVAAVGGFMLLPAFVAFAVDGSLHWEGFLLSALVVTSLGMLVAVSIPRSIQMRNREALLTMPFTLVSCSAAAALPLYLTTDLDFVKAWFEAVSGLTTTGATVMVGLDDLPASVLIWRSILQWLGGINVVVLGMILLPRLGLSGMQIFRIEFYEGFEKTVTRLIDLSKWVVGVYCGLTVLCFLAYSFAGMSTFDAINHAMTTVATGGFSTHDQSFGWFDDQVLESIAVVFMLGSSLPLIRYIQVVRGDVGKGLVRDNQVRFFFRSWVCFVTLAIILLLAAEPSEYTFVEALRTVLFNLTSILTGTGFATDDYSSWGTFAIPLFMLLMVLGGCAGSTSCGLKQFRVYMLFVRLREHLLSMVEPNRVMVSKFNGQLVTDATLDSVTTYFFIFVFTIGAVMAGLSITGLDFITAFSGAISAVSNVGPGLGNVIGPVGSYATLPPSALWLLSCAMLLGRLEILVFLIILLPQFWRKR